MSEDEEDANKNKGFPNDYLDIFYTVCVKYSENMMMNQRFLRPNMAERKRNILDKFTLTNILEADV